MLKRIGAEEGGEFKAVASGTLPCGRPVVVNADGTVSSVVETTDSAGSSSASVTTYSHDIQSAYDSSNNRVVIVFRGANNYPTAAVGTVSGTSVSFGTPVAIVSETNSDSSICFDSSNNKIVITFDHGGSKGVAYVGTVSGTSISFGSEAIFNNAATVYTSATFDSTNNKVVVFYRDSGNSNYGTAVVGTVSGTSISFGSEVVFNSANTTFIHSSFDSSAGKVVAVYKDNGNSFYGTAIVGTVSGTGISFGSEAVFATTNSSYPDITYDTSANKHVIVWQSPSSTTYGNAIVGTVSGTSISFGSAVVFESAAATYLRAIYDPSANKTLVLFRDEGNSNKGTAIVGTVSGTSISFGTAFVIFDFNATYLSGVYDSSTEQVVASCANGDSSENVHSSVISVGGTNLTSENYIGMSRGVAVQTGDAASVGSATVFESASTGVTASTFDSSNNKIVISYRDNGNSYYGTAVVGTVSGSSISFGTPVVFNSATTNDEAGITFDSDSNKVVVIYSTGGEGVAKVGTVSGTSISFGSATVFDAGQGTYMGVTFDSTNNKVVVVYVGTNNYTETRVGTVSGTSISFGTAVVAMSLSADQNTITFDSNRGKVVVCSRISTKGRAAVGTVSGTSISFASNVIFADNQTKYIAPTFDSSNNKVVIAYINGSSTDQGQVVVGDIDGSGVISFGSAVTYNAEIEEFQGIAFDSNLNKVVIAYDSKGTSKGQVISGTVSGTSITLDSETVFEAASVEGVSVAFDSNANKSVISYKDAGNSNYGTSVVFTPTTIATTRAEVADGGNASMDIIGSVSTNQIGLTAGQQYFVQNDGTISTTADSPSVLAGTAISATELVVKT